MSVTMVCLRQKILKLLWLKSTKTVPEKRNLDQKINESKLHIRCLSINFRFSSTKSQSQQRLAKRITHFTMEFRLKNFLHFVQHFHQSVWVYELVESWVVLFLAFAYQGIKNIGLISIFPHYVDFKLNLRLA